MNHHKASCVIVGGGSGSRFSTSESKLHVLLAGKPVYVSSLQNFVHDDRIEEIVLVGSFHHNDIETWFPSHRKIQVVKEGETRTRSVWNGLQKCISSSEWVFIHDAARPFVPPAVIDSLFMASEEESIKGVIPVLPVYDSLKKVRDGTVCETVSKKGVVRAQTPQFYHRKTLLDAYEKNNVSWEDETELLLHCCPSISIKYVPGSYFSEKITDPTTREFLEKLSITNPKVGIGWDFHPFEQGRDLVLGGVCFPHHIGLEGDSDGDVVVHAVIDAILGAIGMGDIGSYFGVKKPSLMGIRSLSLLGKLRTATMPFFWEVGNIDITIVCKTPHIHPHVHEMKKNIAGALRISENTVNVKATTDKGMDSAGQGKGIRAVAIANILQMEVFHG
jgi:2-C-methyl-D-erythritol 4-phosphate cytidylyltransferase / 2-C-methyl-D-erythritol 2,4-cyclodiphosphate synthase